MKRRRRFVRFCDPSTTFRSLHRRMQSQARITPVNKMPSENQSDSPISPPFHSILSFQPGQGARPEMQDRDAGRCRTKLPHVIKRRRESRTTGAQGVISSEFLCLFRVRRRDSTWAQYRPQYFHLCPLVNSKNFGQSGRAQTPNLAPRRWSIMIIAKIVDTTSLVSMTATPLALGHTSRAMPAKRAAQH